MPELTVLMSVYNGERYLTQAIDSILGQTFRDFEFLIIDDASTDNTPMLLADYASRDARIRVYRNDVNLGLTMSLNRGLALAKGRFIARQDADDISLPERLAPATSLLKSTDDIAAVSSYFDWIDADGNPQGVYCQETDSNKLRWQMLFYNHLSGHSGVTFRRDVVHTLKAYNPQYPFAQDYDLWLRVLELARIAVIPQVLFQVRQHEQNISTTRQSVQDDLAIRASKQALQRLIGQPVTPETARALHAFWGRDWTQLAAIHAPPIHKTLKLIYDAFCDHYSPEIHIRNSIRASIAKRYWHWAMMLSTDAVIPRLHRMVLSARWHAATCAKQLLAR